MKLVLHCVPTGKARPRFARRGSFVSTYDSDAQKRAVAEIRSLLLGQTQPSPLQGPLSVHIVAHMPIPKSWPKKRVKAALDGREWHTSKPDADNLAKQLLDCFNGCIWRDDTQVVLLVVEKRYSDAPRWEVEIEPLAA